jgi:hypothetical protein
MWAMTDEERWKIEGRTRDALRQAKHNAGLLRADIEAHAVRLKEASESLQQFLNEPTGAGPTGMSRSDYILHFFKSVISFEIEEKIRELAREAETVAKLEKQIAEF